MVYADPNGDDIGSALIEKGTTRRYRVTEALKSATMRKHQVEADSADDSRFWEAHWELMDMAEGHWIQSIGATSACSRRRLAES